ncbi:hypothetical protein BX616_001163, partial [Lobosporangium transversale]
MNSKRQTFQWGLESFEIPVILGDDETEGKPFVLWDDIKQKAPPTAHLQREKQTLDFMTDAEGKSLPDPLLDTHTPATPYYISDESHMSDIETRSHSNMSTSSYSSEPTTESQVSTFASEYHPRAIQSNPMPQANMRAKNSIEQRQLLKAEMLKRRELQQQTDEMRQSIFQMQQRALDRLAHIRSQVQTILSQNGTWRSSRIPRLFIVLPNNSSTIGSSSSSSVGGTTLVGSQQRFEDLTHSETFRLYFLCECGNHTTPHKGSKIPHHIHLVRHEGYDIENPAEFFRHYGAHILSLLHMMKYGISVAGFTALPLSPQASIEPTSRTQQPSRKLEPLVNHAIEVLENLSANGYFSIISNGPTKQQQKDGLDDSQVVDLKELGAYLKGKEAHGRVGNLHRIITREGHVKWVCRDHYHDRYTASAIKEIREILDVHSGEFDDHLGRIDVTLASPGAALHFYKAIERGKFIQEVKVRMTWDVSMSDLKSLRDVISKSRVVCLELACSASNAASDILNRNKRSDPLWQTIESPRLQSFTLTEYVGFFSRVSVPAATTHLRVLRISERVDWKKDGSRVVDFLRLCPRLNELHLGCTNVDDAYAAIRRTTTGFCPLEHLALDNGATSGMLAKFRDGEPTFMDLLASDISSPLLLGAKGLQILHLRPLTVTEMDPSLVEGLVRRNPILNKLMIFCPVSDFLRSLTIIQETATTSKRCELNTLTLYCNRNLLHATNIQNKISVKLELMSPGVPSDILNSLLRVYGSRLTKFRVEGDASKSLSLLSLTMRHTKSILSRLDIACPLLTPLILRDLKSILECCRSSLSHLSIVVYSAWEGSKADTELANFIVEFGPCWTEIMVSSPTVDAWKMAFSRRGFFVPDD